MRSRIGNEAFSSDAKLLSQTARTCIHLEVRPKMRSQLIVHCEFLTQGKIHNDKEPTCHPIKPVGLKLERLCELRTHPHTTTPNRTIAG